MKNKALISLLALSTVLVLVATPVRAQSFAVETGVAGVENTGLSSNFGAALTLPLGENFTGMLSYTRWRKTDNNLEYDLANPGYSTAPYYGKQGLNLVVLYQLFERGKFSASLGVGFGQYKRVRVTEFGNQQESYSGAFTGSALLKYEVASIVTPYVKATASKEPAWNSAEVDWGFLNIGVMVSPF